VNREPTAYLDPLVVAQMLFLEAEDPDRDLLLYINSAGPIMIARAGAHPVRGKGQARPNIGTLTASCFLA
jgi:ATP-dependent protease ClpP protease subunit